MYKNTGLSMFPTLRHGNWLLCNRMAYGLRLPGFNQPLILWRTPKVGEIVFFRSPRDGRLLVKRVVDPPEGQSLSSTHVWVEGDNAAGSCDSRHFGPVSLQRVLGRATGCFGQSL